MDLIYALVLFTCSEAGCKSKVIERFPSLAVCEARLEAEYEEIKAGQAVGCIPNWESKT